MTFTSASSDRDGSIDKTRWDLDDDGKFDDGSGPVARRSFGSAGEHRVRLQVVDDAGASSKTARTVVVRRPQGQAFSSSPPAPPVVAAPPLQTPPATAPGKRRFTRTPLAPFPIVRARGRIVRGGVIIDILSVRTAPGAHITVRCRARRCPVRSARGRIRRGRQGVRVRAFERRIPAGAVLQIFVTRPRRLGKYTRFLIRRGQPPARRDLCVRSVFARPIRCPF